MKEKEKKFYQLTIAERLAHLKVSGSLSDEDVKALSGSPGLTVGQADQMIENVVGTFALPLGIAQHFLVNGREVLVPMVVEEPSVVAAASFMARLARSGGGFTASADAPEMIGQIQILDLDDIDQAVRDLEEAKGELLEKAAQADPLLVKLGGGPRDIILRKIEDSQIGTFLVLHLVMDVRDAMGANAVNTALERMTSLVESISGGRALLRILTNLADRRLARSQCAIPIEALAFNEYSGEMVRDRIMEAWAFAAADPYRAATHNKGIMNGVDAVVLASGNDWRAVEAGAHAYAARNGKYTSLSVWSVGENGELVGTLEMPMAVGIIGGATRVHPSASAALKLMGIQSASELAEIIVSVGLAQNLGALRALATEGIQRGHMSLHARQVAAAAGVPQEWINPIIAQMIKEGNIHVNRALEIMDEWKTRRTH
ncbi:MAG: hydroxymethylglutaryl-CoA reductase, degradative [Anaerolineaceae bacterium]|nr:hydroxymethylglutaryl-CoA reductase, degradative [Anaerolineaceae bacterium]